MSRPARFVQTAYVVPPGGAWFFQLGDERVSSSVYELALRRVDELLKRHGVYTHLVTDHWHYWEQGGSDYQTKYNSSQKPVQ